MKRDLLDILVCPFSHAPFQLEALESAGDTVEFGFLKSEAGTFPIIAGIPMLLAVREDLGDLLRRGHFEQAVVQAAFWPVPASGLWRFVKPLSESYRLRWLGRKMERRRLLDWQERIRAVLFPKSGPRPGARRLFELAYKECGLRTVETFHYYYCRYGLPNQLVATSFVQMLSPRRPGGVLDLACGAGHITGAIQARVGPQPVVGLDGYFFSLYAGRSVVAPEVSFVCGDVLHTPFREGVFSDTFCSDAFHNFAYKRSAIREMERVLDADGRILLVTMRNRLREQLLMTRPYTPAGYRGLVNHLPHRLLDDDGTLRRYLKGLGPATQEDSLETLNRAVSLSMWAAKGSRPDVAERELRFDILPHATGELGVNPIFQPTANGGSGEVYERRFPSEFYATEDSEMKFYYPERFTLTAEQRAALDANRPGPLKDLIGNGAVVGFPPRYRD